MSTQADNGRNLKLQEACTYGSPASLVDSLPMVLATQPTTVLTHSPNPNKLHRTARAHNSVLPGVNTDIQLPLCPDRPNLLVQKIPRPDLVKHEVIVPQHFGQRQAQLGISQVSSDAVSHPNRPRLVSSIVVICKQRVRLVEVTLRDELVWLGEVVVCKVRAEVARPHAHLPTSAFHLGMFQILLHLHPEG